MRASKNDTGTISKKLAKFLLAYQSTSHQTTNETPSMLFMGRELKTRLHNIKPNIRNRVIAIRCFCVGKFRVQNLIYVSSPFTSCFCFYTLRYRSCFCFIVPDRTSGTESLLNRKKCAIAGTFITVILNVDNQCHFY
jgi:hypothetical protein